MLHDIGVESPCVVYRRKALIQIDDCNFSKFETKFLLKLVFFFFNESIRRDMESHADVL